MNSDIQESPASEGIFIRIFQFILVSILLATVALVLTQVFSRYVIEKNVKGVEELSRMLIVFGTFLGAGYASIKNEHITVDILIGHIKSPMFKSILAVCTYAIILFVSYTMMVEGAKYTLRYWKYPDYSTSLLLPRALYYLPVSIGGLIILLDTIKKIIKQLLRRG